MLAAHVRLTDQRKALSWVDDGHAEAGQPIEVAPVERIEFIGPAGSGTHEDLSVVGKLADPAALFKAIHQLPGFMFAEADLAALATKGAVKQFACRLVGQWYGLGRRVMTDQASSKAGIGTSTGEVDAIAASMAAAADR